MKFKNVFTLIICVLIPLAVGGISGFATKNGLNPWYAGLIKPSFNPPNYLFAPVWTSLYIMMGIALFLVWKNPVSENRKKSIRIFGIQLALNFLWSFLFFYFNTLGLALIEIGIMWLSISITIYYFYKENKNAAYLLIPYLLWVSFASVLNGSIWYLN